MDLLDFTPKSDLIVVTIKHPLSGEVFKNDDGSDMTVTLYAPYSKEYKKVLHELTDLRIKKMQEKGKREVTAEEIDEATLETIAKTTKEWNITFGGEVPKLSAAKAKEVYDKVFWIKAQLEEATEASLDFMKA